MSQDYYNQGNPYSYNYEQNLPYSEANGGCEYQMHNSNVSAPSNNYLRYNDTTFLQNSNFYEASSYDTTNQNAYSSNYVANYTTEFASNSGATYQPNIDVHNNSSDYNEPVFSANTDFHSSPQIFPQMNHQHLTEDCNTYSGKSHVVIEKPQTVNIYYNHPPPTNNNQPANIVNNLDLGVNISEDLLKDRKLQFDLQLPPIICNNIVNDSDSGTDYKRYVTTPAVTDFEITEPKYVENFDYISDFNNFPDNADIDVKPDLNLLNINTDISQPPPNFKQSMHCPVLAPDYDSCYVNNGVPTSLRHDQTEMLTDNIATLPPDGMTASFLNRENNKNLMITSDIECNLYSNLDVVSNCNVVPPLNVAHPPNNVYNNLNPNDISNLINPDSDAALEFNNSQSSDKINSSNNNCVRSASPISQFLERISDCNTRSSNNNNNNNNKRSVSPITEFLEKLKQKSNLKENQRILRLRSPSAELQSRSRSRSPRSHSNFSPSVGRRYSDFQRVNYLSSYCSNRKSPTFNNKTRSRSYSQSPEPPNKYSGQNDYECRSNKAKYQLCYVDRQFKNFNNSMKTNSLSNISRKCNKTQDFDKDKRQGYTKSCDEKDKYHKDSSEDVENEFTEREVLLMKYRKDYCSTAKEINYKLNELSKSNYEDKQVWTRMSPADLYYQMDENDPKILKASPKLSELCNQFENVLIKRSDKVRETLPKYELPVRKKKMKLAKHKSSKHGSCSGSNSKISSDSSDSDVSSSDDDCTMEELERKRKHPLRLHPELWFNDIGEMNDGPLCRCSAKAQRSGIRHNIYAGELDLPKCDVNTNNSGTLYHYRITISPPTNFLIKTPTIITHDDHEFIFEGFSMFSHGRLNKLPLCKVIRFNIEYTIIYYEEKMPENFTVQELDLFYEYLFKELLELVDLDFKAGGDGSRCAQFHFMPRFVRELPDNGKEILSMNQVLKYLLNYSDDLVKEEELEKIQTMPQYEWQKRVDVVKGMIVTIPGMKPCSLRVDQLDRDQYEGKTGLYPDIVHFGIRPPQLSYAGNPEYQKAWREYVKFRHLLANRPKPSFEDKRKLESKEYKLQEMRTQSKMKRDVTVTVNSKSFKMTGIMCDIVQHAMLIPVLVSHLRFHRSLDVLEKTIGYKFDNRYLLQLALTHPSYRENFGTNPDHARNSLTNCGIRQPEYGDRRIHYMNTRKRGINTLINIMSRFGKKTETESNITHNERLEFLGDAVVEFITSIHLFHLFPDLEEGGLATYRAAIVQNQHLAILAKKLCLDEFMLYAHGSDLCHDLELRHAMANCFEAFMGALFLDGGIEVAGKVFGETLFQIESTLMEVWKNYPPHPLQDQEPLGDRKWIPRFDFLKKLTTFEESIGVKFSHIRLLARAFTDRSIGYTNLTLGSNQRLEFLGDTVLQLIASEYLYKYFPEHHEGHLSLLRSSLVNNRTQAVVCDDLDMTKYALYHNPKAELKTKDRADLLEAFLGALYVDQDLEACEVFCNVCFFPRLQKFIMRQDWNDPKSKLQQCCLTLRTMEGGEPEIPVYKVIECMGPTNTRIYTVAVYFKGKRLAKASGHSIQQAEMNAAKKALLRSKALFPQLDHQKRVIAKSLKSQCGPNKANIGINHVSNNYEEREGVDNNCTNKSNNRIGDSKGMSQYNRNSGQDKQICNNNGKNYNNRNMFNKNAMAMKKYFVKSDKFSNSYRYNNSGTCSNDNNNRNNYLIGKRKVTKRNYYCNISRSNTICAGSFNSSDNSKRSSPSCSENSDIRSRRSSPSRSNGKSDITFGRRTSPFRNEKFAKECQNKKP